MVVHTFYLSIQEEASLVYKVTMGTQQKPVSEKKKAKKKGVGDTECGIHKPHASSQPR